MFHQRFAPALLALALLTHVSVAHAAHAPPPAPEGDGSVATTDDARALLFNPAAVGVRYPAELFAGFALEDARREWSGTLLTRGGFGAIALRQRDSSRAYGAAFAFGGEKLRFGWSPYWLVSNRATSKRVADHRIGLLSRPAPWLSVGVMVDRLFEPEFRAARRARRYSLGLGLRPLALSPARAHGWGTRVTLSGDVTIVDENEWSRSRVRIAGEFEPAPGVVMQVAFTDHTDIRATLTLRGVRWSLHGGGEPRRDRPQSRAYALSLHGGEEASVLAPRASRRVAVVRVGGLLADEAIGGLSLAGGETATVSARPIHHQLERALEDPLTRGVLLDLRGAGGMAQLEELRPRIARLRAAGKPVVAFMEYGGGRGDLYLASACDRAIATESAGFAPLGLRVERRYWREALARLGLRVQRSSTGAYKSAFRNFSVDSMPAADSAAVLRDLDVRQRLFTDAVCSGRKLSPEQLAPFLDGRPWIPAELVRGGVLDSIGYREDVMRVVGTLAGLGAKPRTVNLAKTPAARRAWSVPSPVAIVYAGGGIASGRSGNDLLMGPFMGDQTVIAALERAFHAPGVKAVVFRVDSPGGEVLASDLIDHAVQRLKRETGKPFVVSMGSVAASGGYYISCHADWIVADRHTRTGSIGVLTAQPSFEGLYGKLRVRQESLDRGEFMPGTSWSHDWTAREQAAVDSSIGRFYDAFVARVASGRRLDPALVREAAQGRVWMGEDALERHLVDALGGLDDAVLEARRRAHVPPGERIRLLELGRPRGSFLERLLGNWVRETLAREARVSLGAGAQYRDADGVEPIVE